MTDKTEMVLVSRDELQQLIGASVRCAFEEYRQEHIGVLHHQATGGEMGREHSDHLAA